MKKKNDTTEIVSDIVPKLVTALVCCIFIMMGVVILHEAINHGDGVEGQLYAPYLYTATGEWGINSVQRLAVDDQMLRACAVYVADGVTYFSTDYHLLLSRCQSVHNPRPLRET